MVSRAKDNGSTDNITVIVVFLKPVDQILEEAKTNRKLGEGEELSQEEKEKLFEGITSTSAYITMNGNTEAAELAEPAQNENPFASPIVTGGGGGLENGEGGQQKSLFDSPAGGGMIFSDFSGTGSPGGPDPFSTSGDLSGTGEPMKGASPSMFEQSLSTSDEEKSRGGSEEDRVDFMANQEHNWIQNNNLAKVKNDSGFISPACQSSNKASSEEGSTENREEEDEVRNIFLSRRPSRAILFYTLHDFRRWKAEKLRLCWRPAALAPRWPRPRVRVRTAAPRVRFRAAAEEAEAVLWFNCRR